MFSGLSPAVQAIIFGLCLFTALLGGLLYQMAFGPRARLDRRIAAVSGNAQRRAARPAAQAKRRQVKLKDRDQAKRKSYLQRLNDEIAQAGLAISIRRYYVLSLILGLVSTALYWASGLPRIGVPLVAVTMGLGAPKFILSFRRKRRVKRFVALFPDALDVIVRGIKSGLPVGECIAVIAREMPDPVGTEFRMLAEAQRLGMTLDEALRRSIERVPNPELRFFSIVLTIQQQTGGNLADTLGKLSEVLRNRKKMRDKIQAMSSEAKASASIIGSLPFFVTGILALVAPDYIGLLLSTSAGHTFMLIGFVIMGIGIFVMRQMINFDI